MKSAQNNLKCVTLVVFLTSDLNQVGYLGGALFLVFAVATFCGVF